MLVKKSKSIGRKVKSGNRDNNKRRTCNRQIVSPSDCRNKPQNKDENRRNAAKSRMAVNRCFENIKRTLLDNVLSLQERVKVLENLT